MNSISPPHRTFDVLAKDGRRVASAEHLKDAKLFCDALPEAHSVIRCADGIVMAIKAPLTRRERAEYIDVLPTIHLEPCRSLAGYDELRSTASELRRSRGW